MFYQLCCNIGVGFLLRDAPGEGGSTGLFATGLYALGWQESVLKSAT